MVLVPVYTLSAAMLIYQYLSSRLFYYRLSLLALTQFIVIFTHIAQSPVTTILLTSVVILSVAIYDGLISLILFSLLMTLESACVMMMYLLKNNTAGLYIAIQLGGYFFLSFVLCGGSFLVIRYRERLIDALVRIDKLDQALVNMNRANREYQDYLREVEARSTSSERRRIVRDIHDIVGYALTNNIMLMEMATDMMKEDPLEVSKLINLARDNAQEGLSHIRSILYDYQSQRDDNVEGLSAITKLISVFELATGIKVDRDFIAIPATFGYEIDSIVYHLIEEGMMNSFRHGNADRIRILLIRETGTLRVIVRDNGIGCEEPVDGIGLAGMRERVRKAKGEITIGSVADGFEIKAAIPLKNEDTGGADYPVAVG
jgi:signal transduction histidine kinase